MIAALVWLLACGGSDPAIPLPAPAAPVPEAPTPDATRPAVVSASFPSCWLVDRLARDLVDHQCAGVAGEDPRTFKPSAELVLDLQQADLIVMNGAGYEAWLDTAGVPPDRLLNTALVVKVLDAPGTTHSHGAHGAHSHAGPDPHIWADPQRYLAQAESVRAELTELLPSHADALQASFRQLSDDLGQLDRLLEVATAGAKYRAIAANHPSFAYAADRYGLTIAVVDVDPNAPPSAETTTKINAWMAGKADPLWLWEAPPSAEVLASMPAGLHHVTVDPLEQPPEGGHYNWLAQARSNVTVLTKALGAHDH